MRTARIVERVGDGADEPASLPQALVALMLALDATYTAASRELGLTAQQAQLLCAASHPASVRTVARTLRCDRTNVTRLADRAADKGWLRRRHDQHDGRVTVIELTPAGRRLADRLQAAVQHRLADLVSSWPSHRRQAALDLLADLTRGLETRLAEH